MSVQRVEAGEPAGDAGIVHERRERAKRAFGGVEKAPDLLFARHVSLDRRRSAAGTLDIADHAARGRAVHGIVHGYGVLAGASEPRDGGADAAATARNDHGSRGHI
jgi:hypothetical protein